jgi:hypothetical protein
VHSAKTQKIEARDNEQTSANRKMSKQTKQHGTYHQQESKSD